MSSDDRQLTISEALREAQKITRLHSDSPSLDAQVLLGHILQKPLSWVLAHPESRLSPDQQVTLSQSLSQLESGTPLPYLLGHWEFYGLKFSVSPAVLIPRPETELLVEAALSWLRAHPDQRAAADIGTGSGCIAVALAKHIPDLHVTATDTSPEALEVAQANAEKHAVDQQIEFIQTDLLNVERSLFDVICANPPYISTATLHSLKVYGREPTLALDGGADGLKVIRTLMKEAPERLAPGGLVVVEIGASQGLSALALAQEAFAGADIQILTDLAGHDRLVRVETNHEN